VDIRENFLVLEVAASGDPISLPSVENLRAADSCELRLALCGIEETDDQLAEEHMASVSSQAYIMLCSNNIAFLAATLSSRLWLDHRHQPSRGGTRVMQSKIKRGRH
jgi:hypothetical protein